MELFAVASIALLLIPGPAVLYVVTQSAEQGRSAGLASVAGIHIGTFVHIVAAAVGLSALILASAVAFSVVEVRRRGVPRLPRRAEAARARADADETSRGARRSGTSSRGERSSTCSIRRRRSSSSRSCRSSSTRVAAPSGRRSSCSDWSSSRSASSATRAYALLGDAAGSLLRRRATAMRRVSGSIYIGLGAVAAFARR